MILFPNIRNILTGRRLACFSPEVMLATFLIETVMALYVLARYRRGLFAKVAALMLLLLALFQGAESQICSGNNSLLWARAGFAAITLLPPLGLYLVSQISHQRHFLNIGAAISAVFVAYFIFTPKIISRAICAGNYVIFNWPRDVYWLFGFYYFAFLVLAIWESLEHMRGQSKKARRILWWVIAGYSSFLLPLAAVYIIIPATRAAVASIMCGFALIFAYILSFEIVPKFYKE